MLSTSSPKWTVNRRNYCSAKSSVFFPGHQIVSEEVGLVPGSAADQWYVDPLDGTVNYAHGIPIFSVSIAYARDGVVTLGVVYDPMQDELFAAERGQGAWCNGRRLQVSQVTDFQHSLLVTGFPYDAWTTQHDNLENFGRFARITQGVRRLGSAALDLCYVAAGRFDGYWELSLNPWDLAAGALIALEAGAVVTNLDGAKGYSYSTLFHAGCPARPAPQNAGDLEQQVVIFPSQVAMTCSIRRWDCGARFPPGSWNWAGTL